MNGEARKERTSNIFKYKDVIKGIDTACVFHSFSVRLSGQGFVPIAYISIRPISLRILAGFP
jgi:hypothetical protein